MTPIQAQTVMFLFILGTAILNIPAIITALAKQDAWLSVLLASLVGWLTPLMVVILCQMHQRRSLVDVCQSVMGPYAGALLGAGYVFYAIHLGVLVTNDVGMFETMMLQPQDAAMAVTSPDLARRRLCLSPGPRNPRSFQPNVAHHRHRGDCVNLSVADRKAPPRKPPPDPGRRMEATCRRSVSRRRLPFSGDGHRDRVDRSAGKETAGFLRG